MLESTIDVEIVLPDEAIALIPVVKAFQAAKRSGKIHTEWFLLCSNRKSLVNWNNRAFSDDRLNNIEFSACVARAYLGLFQISKQDIPHCVPSERKKASMAAKKMIDTLSNINQLPGKASFPVFHEGLNDIFHWPSSAISMGASACGNPVVRWLINKIAEEFCYSFDCEPTTNIIGDLVRLGFPKLTDRSIRNTFTEKLSSQALETARIRRDNDNKSKVIAHLVISALPSTSKGITTHQPMMESLIPICGNDKQILEIMEKCANKLSDNSSKRRLISVIKAIQYDEQYYLEDDGN